MFGITRPELTRCINHCITLYQIISALTPVHAKSGRRNMQAAPIFVETWNLRITNSQLHTQHQPLLQTSSALGVDAFTIAYDSVHLLTFFFFFSCICPFLQHVFAQAGDRRWCVCDGWLRQLVAGSDFLPFCLRRRICCADSFLFLSFRFVSFL